MSHSPESAVEWLRFPRSDGDGSRNDLNTQEVLNRHGKVTYYRPLTLDDAASLRWRATVGNALAKQLGLPGECDIRFDIYREV